MSEEYINILQSDSQIAQVTQSTMTNGPDSINGEDGSMEMDGMQILMNIKYHDSSRLIDESYQKFKAELSKMYEDNQSEFKNFLPNLPEEDSAMKSATNNANYALSVLCLYLFAALFCILVFYANSVIKTSMFSDEVLETMKLWLPYAYCLMGLLLFASYFDALVKRMLAV